MGAARHFEGRCDAEHGADHEEDAAVDGACRLADIEDAESDDRERAADGALRELHEETGITARLVGLVDVVDAIFTSRQSGETHRHFVLFDYAAIWEAGDPVAGDDADHAEWISPDRLESLGLWRETLRIIAAARTLVQADSRIA